ncbi:hypothetical protein E3T55_05795 [Cryobacterium frigoriphilum]|uniref:Acyltransferase 3 domain-containing protein n=1 Tax=Cryobacterium frigoriphilum TaxID=1259150 RepID=A0A4R9A623_9MICO|nr:acyltransferase family protein [Cryobacterium frigoriphilum]TFD53011.1 hypothetical protein E3T55_05795 [Cryobacterium frigoriphilum]
MGSVSVGRTTRRRSVAIDTVRVVGLIAVVAGHMWAGSPDDSANPVRIALYSWHVPLFFFLTGYMRSQHKPLAVETIARARSLLVPFAAWTIILGVPYFYWLAQRDGSFLLAITETLWGGGVVRGMFAPYWFLPLLFFVAVLLRALDLAPRWIAWTLGLSGLAASYLFGSTLAMLPHDVFFTLPCMLFALVGAEIRKGLPRVRHSGWWGLTFIAAAAVLLATEVAAPLDMKVGNFGTPVLSVLVALLICAGMVAVATTILDGRDVRAGVVITELARTSMVVLLTHTFFYWLLPAFPLSNLAIFAIALAGSWLLGAAIHRSPFSMTLAGIPRVAPTTSRTDARAPTAR